MTRLLLPCLLASALLGQHTVADTATPVVQAALLRTALVPATPEALVTAGGSWFTNRPTVHTAILIQHPQGNLLFDAGLGSRIDEEARDMPLWARPLLQYEKETPARQQLDQAGIRISQIYLSHGHWDHLSGVRDFPEATVHLPDSERRYLQTDRPPRVLPSIGQDPAIRWQVMQDLLGMPAAEVAAERARVATEGWGAQLLARQASDGRWGGAAWNRGWNSTMHVLMLLRDMGLDPASDQSRDAIERVRAGVTWQGCGPPECDNNPFFAGEVEPCINGQVGAIGAYFAQDATDRATNRGLIARLLTEQLPDGGWNCEAVNGSTRSSFNTTICVLEALLAHEQHIESRPEITVARLRGQEYLLERRLFRRRSTGEVIEQDRKGNATWTRFAFPTWWHYDVLRGLEHLRQAGVAPDERVAEAVNLVVSKRESDGRWPLEVRYPGKMPLEIDEGEGRPSRWNTLRALRVLAWFNI